LGDEVVQPSSTSPSLDDSIGVLSFVKIDMEVDCGVITLNDKRPAYVNRILSVGTLKGSAPPVLGTLVKKVGAETGLTVGQIVQLNVDGFTNTGPFINHIKVCSPFGLEYFSEEGDSGSIVFDENQNIIGVVRAGRGSCAVVMPWSKVEKYCDITLNLCDGDSCPASPFS